jgi:isoleucyl-tRNA synthetase
MKESATTTSVFLAEFPRVEEKYIDDELEARWNKILAVRGEAAKVLEALRRDKKIGHSLDAAVTLYVAPELFELLDKYKKDLAFIFIVSSVSLAKEADATADAYTSDVIQGLRIAAGPATGTKCGRCWMYVGSVGTVKDHPELCSRCAGNLP